MRPKHCVMALLAAWFLTAAASFAIAGPGDLVWFAFDPSCDFYSYTNNVAVQSDSKPVLIGRTDGGGWTIVRFTATGSLDSTFGVNGKVELFSGYLPNHAYGVAIDATDRIVVVGRQGDPARFTVVRLLSNGVLDPGFGSGGIVVTAFSRRNEDVATAVAVQPDGKIVAAGTTRDNKGYKAYALARYNPDGSLDTQGFGAPTGGDRGGKKKPPSGDPYTGYIIDDPTNGKHDGIFQGAITLQSNGKILVGGFVNYSATGPDVQGWTLSRYSTDGSLDTGFADNGRTTLTTYGPLEYLHIKGLGVQSDGRIVVGGRGRGAALTPFYGIAIRYTSDGAVDSTFGSGGLAVTPDPTHGTNIAIQADDKIVIGASGDAGGLRLFRWTSSGLADVTFGTGGYSALAGVGTSQFQIGVALSPLPPREVYTSGGGVTSVAKFYSQ